MYAQHLDSQEAALRRATHEAMIEWTDLTDTASTAKTIALWTALPAGTRIEYVGYQLDTDFDGGATSELTLALGWDLGSGTDDSDGLLAATSIHADGTEVQYHPTAQADVDASTVDATYGAEEQAVLGSVRTRTNALLKLGEKVFDDTATINAILTATGANLTALTQGKIRIWFRILPLATA